MKKKLVKSQYGVWIDVYEVEHEGRILWFRDYEIEAAAKRRETSRQDYADEDLFVIRMD